MDAKFKGFTVTLMPDQYGGWVKLTQNRGDSWPENQFSGSFFHKCVFAWDFSLLVTMEMLPMHMVGKFSPWWFPPCINFYHHGNSMGIMVSRWVQILCQVPTVVITSCPFANPVSPWVSQRDTPTPILRNTLSPLSQFTLSAMPGFAQKLPSWSKAGVSNTWGESIKYTGVLDDS